MCDVAKAISRAFSPPGTGAMMNELDRQQAQAQQDADAASKAMQNALAQAQQASLPALDNPAAMAAQRDQMRKLLEARGANFSFSNAPTAAPATATKVLLGQ